MMKTWTKGLMGMIAAASVVGTAPAYAGISTAVPSQGYSKSDDSANFYRKKDRRYYASRDQRINRNTRVWRGKDGRYRCKKDNGTTGLLIGGAAGGLAGHEIAGNGDKLLGTIIGAGAGALIGREIDRDKYRCR
jgi:uncharacterized protein YcfJ